jgi:hypothetical protein
MKVKVEISIDRSVDSKFWKEFFDNSLDVARVVWYGTAKGCERLDVYHGDTHTQIGFPYGVELEPDFWERVKGFEFPVDTSCI